MPAHSNSSKRTGTDITDLVTKHGLGAEELSKVMEEGRHIPPPRNVRRSWAEIAETDYPEPRWVIPNVLPQGFAILAGRPKIGKSWFAMQVAGAVGTGGMCLGRRVQAGQVLYIALEDSERRIKDRGEKQGWPKSALVDFLCECDLERLATEVEQTQPALVVVDTLNRLWAADGLDTSDPSVMTQAFGRLHSLAAEHECTIVGIEHHRKRALENVVDDILGTTSKAAVPDTILGLYRERGRRVATLQVTGRDVKEQELPIEFDPLTFCWQVVEGEGRQGTTEVMEVLEKSSDPIGVREIARQTGLYPSQVSRILTDLLSVGRVRRMGQKYVRVPDMRE